MNTWVKGLLLLAVLPLSLQRENPEYGWWASFQPGSWVKLRLQGEIESRTFTLDQTQTLVAVTSEKILVTRRDTMLIGGNPVPANKDLDEVARHDEQALKIEREGEEEILVAGKTLMSRWIEGLDPKTNARVKFWIVGDVPGGIARGEIRPEGTTSVTTLTILSWERR